MTENDWAAAHPDRGFRELLDAVAAEGLEALDAFKHKQIELENLENAFYISQRMLQEARHILGEDNPEFADMLIRSIDGCLHAGKEDAALRQAEYLRSLLEKAGDTSSSEYQYAVGAQAFCLTGLEMFDLAIPALELMHKLQNDVPVPEQASTLMDLAAAYAGSGRLDEAKAVCGQCNEKVLVWARQAADSSDDQDGVTAFSLCAYAIDVSMTVLTRLDPGADASWALDALLAYRGMLYRLNPSASTIHSPDGDVYGHARGALPGECTFADCVRYEDLLMHRIADILFYKDGSGQVRYALAQPGM